MTAPDSISSLVRHFQSNLEDYRNPRYNETQLRQEFINPFFTALGWDVNNTAGAAEAYKPVVHEDAVKVSGATKAPDYSFRIGGTRKFFVETKKPAVKIAESGESAFQLRRYAWSAKLALSILTDFEEFAVYDCRVKPAHTDKASAARIMLLPYTDYLPRWEELCDIFSPEAITRGSFDRFAESEKLKKGTARVDDAFLSEIERWRDELARSIAVRNPSLSVRELNFAVQRVIDRIVFLRICEDRGVEEYGRLQALLNGGRVYPRLVELFLEADQRYNSGLFHFRPEKDRPEPPDELTTGLEIDDKALKDILKNLYYPDSPYEFSVFSADILGQVYEQFLGKVIRLTAGHHAVVENKPEVKKAGGVYYTPVYIVEYIVKNTVGKLLSGKTLRSMKQAPIRILDPACGSGSFLIQAYQYLLDWYGDKYAADGAQKHGKEVYRGAAGVWRLSTAERKRILLAHIFGVDIDPQAVEVTKLSLLLKVLEGENYESLNRQMAMFHERALPDLGGNIKCGNSLIGSDYFAGRVLKIAPPRRGSDENMDDEYRRINPFDWEKEFAEIMEPRQGGGGPAPQKAGFDVVIGNPPWGSLITAPEKAYLKLCYHNKKGEAESHLFFIEKAINLLKASGLLGMITPNTWLAVLNSYEIRAFLLETCGIQEITELTKYIFSNAPDITPILLFIRNAFNSENKCRVRRPTVVKVTSSNFSFVFSEQDISQKHWLDGTSKAFNLGLTPGFLSVNQKLKENTVLLGDVAEVLYGIKTGDNERFLNREKTKLHKVQALKTAELKRYSITWKGYYLWWTPDLAGYRKKPIEIPKIVVQYIRKLSLKQRIIAAMDYKGIYYPLNNYSYITKQDKSGYDLLYVLGFLNSKTVNFFYANTFIDYNIKPTYLAKIPIRTINFSDPADVARHDRMVSLVETMLSLHKKLPAARTPEDKIILQKQIETTDRQIDALVYELYGLTEEEIRIVECGGNGLI